MDAKKLVLNEFHNLVWHCHKNAQDTDSVKAHYHRVKGILFALWKVEAIDLVYYRTMIGNANKLYQNTLSKHMGE